MTTYTLTVSTSALGLGVINGARVSVARKRTQVTDIYGGQPLSTNNVATNSSGVATMLLEPDDGSVYHELKIFDLAGIPVYSRIFSMPPQTIALVDLPIADIVTQSAAAAVAASLVAVAAKDTAVAASATSVEAKDESVAASATSVAASATAVTARNEAVDAQVEAENARDLVIANGDIYPDIATGLANTANGRYFSVPQNYPASVYADLYYKNNSGTEEYIQSYPSSNGLDTAFMQMSTNLINTQTAIVDCCAFS